MKKPIIFPESVPLTAAEVAQMRYKLYRIQRLVVSHSTPAYNQARHILNLLSKAERREVRAITKKSNQ